MNELPELHCDSVGIIVNKSKTVGDNTVFLEDSHDKVVAVDAGIMPTEKGDISLDVYDAINKSKTLCRLDFTPQNAYILATMLALAATQLLSETERLQFAEHFINTVIQHEPAQS